MKNIERSKKMANLKIDGNGIELDVNVDSVTINNNHTLDDLRTKIINYLYEKDFKEYTMFDLDLLKMLSIEK